MKNLILAVALFTMTTWFVTAEAAVYAQLSSDSNQRDSSIILENIDGLSGIELSSKTTVLIKQRGSYMVIMAPQTRMTRGCGNWWMSVNGIGAPNSNVRACQNTHGQTQVVVSQGILELDRGDRITFMQSGDLGIQATQPDDEPLVPSIIVTIYKL